MSASFSSMNLKPKSMLFTVGLVFIFSSCSKNSSTTSGSLNTNISTTTTPTSAPISREASQLTELTHTLLKMNKNDPAAENIAKQRNLLMLSVLQSDPQLVGQTLLPKSVRSGFPAQVQNEMESETTDVSGEIQTLCILGNQSESRVENRIQIKDGARLVVHTTTGKDLQPGSRIHVRKAIQLPTSDRIAHVLITDTSAENFSLTQISARPKISFSTNPDGTQTRRILAAVVNFADDSNNQSWTPEYIRTSLIPQVASYFKSASYGNMNLQVDVIPRIITTNANRSTGCWDTGTIAYDVQNAAQGGGFNYSSYNSIVMFEQNITCSDYRGMGTYGGAPALVWMTNIRISDVNHELGHNMGLAHSHLLKCSPSVNTGDCKTEEYGDSGDTMGNSSPAHYNAFQKERLGWLNQPGFPQIQTVDKPGTYELSPYENLPGNIKALKISKGDGKYYYVEFRQAIDWDTTISPIMWNGMKTNHDQGLLIHEADPNDWNSSDLLNMHPTGDRYRAYNVFFPALETGETFSGGTTSSVVNIRLNYYVPLQSASVDISFGARSLTCSTADPSISVPTSTQWIKTGENPTYIVTIKNNDTEGCPYRSFNFSVTKSDAIKTDLSTTGFYLAAGQVSVVEIWSGLQASAKPGLYPITFSLSESARSLIPLNATFNVGIQGQTALSASLQYSSTQASSYTFDPSQIEFTSNTARLTQNSQTQVSDYRSQASEILGGLAFDPTLGSIRMTSSGSSNPNLGLDSSWVPSPKNLVGYWHFDGNGTLPNQGVISSVFGEALTLQDRTNTGIPFTSGKLNQGLQFNGSNSLLQANSLVNTSNNVTLMAWINIPAGKSNLAEVISIGDYVAIRVGTSLTGFYFNKNGWSMTSGNTDSALIGTGWHHVAYSVDSDRHVQTLYVDGTSIASSQYSEAILYQGLGTHLVVGAHGNGQGYNFTGTMDEPAVWNTAVSADDLKTIYAMQSTQYTGIYLSKLIDSGVDQTQWSGFSWKPTLPFQKELPDQNGKSLMSESQASYPLLTTDRLMDGIVGIWHLNQSWQDSSGQGNHATPINAGFSTSSKLGSAAAQFTGTTQYAEIAGNSVLQNLADSSFTLSAWYNPQESLAQLKTTAQAHGILIRPGYHSGLWYGMGNKFSFTQYFSGSNAVQVSSQDSFEPGKYYHVVGVFDQDAGLAKLFVNGRLTGLSSFQPHSSPYSYGNTPWRMGIANPTWNNYRWQAQGLLDETAIWNRGLSETEIAQLYRRGSARLKFQIRTCTASPCSDSSSPWMGPDHTSNTYFSEVGNTTVSGPSFTFSNEVGFQLKSGRYFQYRVFFETDDVDASFGPELNQVSVGWSSFNSKSPSIMNNSAIPVDNLSSITEQLGALGCSSGIKYQLSRDQKTWYYWAGSSWQATLQGDMTANFQQELNSQLQTFGSQVGSGNLFLKAFLRSDGSSPCELSSLLIQGN